VIRRGDKELGLGEAFVEGMLASAQVPGPRSQISDSSDSICDRARTRSVPPTPHGPRTISLSLEAAARIRTRPQLLTLSGFLIQAERLLPFRESVSQGRATSHVAPAVADVNFSMQPRCGGACTSGPMYSRTRISAARGDGAGTCTCVLLVAIDIEVAEGIA
jgi:hypothetical protein